MTPTPSTPTDLIFDIEVDSFCHGLRAFPGKLSQELVYRVLKELKPAILTAFEQLENFDFLKISRRLSDATGNVLSEKEIVFFLSLLFPLPEQLDEDSQCSMAEVIDKADQKYSTLLSDLEIIWKQEREKELQEATKMFSRNQNDAFEQGRLRL